MTNIINNIASTISNWYRRRSTIHALSALNDHLLKDIGIDRSQIHSIAAEVAGDTKTSRISAIRSASPAEPRRTAPAITSEDDNWRAAA